MINIIKILEEEIQFVKYIIKLNLKIRHILMIYFSVGEV